MAGLFFQQYSKQSLPAPLLIPGCDLFLIGEHANNSNALWYDQSQYHYPLTKTGVQPILTPNVQNGKAGYVFGGATYFTGGDILDLHTGGYSMFVVYKEVGNNFCIVAGKSNLSGAAGEYGLFSQDINTPWSGLQPSLHAIGTYNQSNFQTASLIVDRGGANLINTLYMNGVIKAQFIGAPVATDFDVVMQFMIGARDSGNFNFDGTICAIIRYDRNVNPTEQAIVEGWLKTYYQHY